jgi:hypothetical protein
MPTPDASKPPAPSSSPERGAVPDEEKKYQRAMFVTTSENTTMVAVGIYELKGSATEGEYWKCMAQMMLHPKDAYEMAARFSWCAIQIEEAEKKRKADEA